MADYGIRLPQALNGMILKLSFFALVCLTISCGGTDENPKAALPQEKDIPGDTVTYYKRIGDIPVPGGYERLPAPAGSFAEWLRTVPLKKDRTVYMYDGSKKRNQGAQFAVVDIPTGKKDLQQCADVVMRLRAEYLFTKKEYTSIAFMDYNGKWYKWQGGGDRPAFDNYLQTVFGWCGSASLEKQLKAVPDLNNMQTGDVLVQGGFPGHAVTVVDIAMNREGKKIYMLVQGYQPAQDMHVLVNPVDLKLSPWYGISNEEIIYTPEWHFKRTNLKTW